MEENAVKKYKVSLNVSSEIHAESEAEAIEIFWDDLNENMSGGEELAEVIEI
jgi:hypothetical protein